MPANETPQFNIGKVSESITRAHDQLEFVIHAFYDSTGDVSLLDCHKIVDIKF
jgi:hypothetical protein